MKLTLAAQPAEDLPYVVKVTVTLTDLQPDERDRTFVVALHSVPSITSWLPSWHVVREVKEESATIEFRGLTAKTGHFVITAEAYAGLNYLAQGTLDYDQPRAP